MQTIPDLIMLLAGSYLVGAVPFGLLVVWLINGKDVRKTGSGRTGGTNAGRAAGLLAGIATAVLDFLKGAAVVWLARAIFPGLIWPQVAAPILAIIGHNYSVFLIEKSRDGKLRLRGGAGGATCFGGSFGLWPVSMAIMLPFALVTLFGIGYASVTTMAIGLMTIVIFAYRAAVGLGPWIYAVYGVIAEVLLVIALLPNIRRLIKGTERLVGLRARKDRTS